MSKTFYLFVQKTDEVFRTDDAFTWVWADGFLVCFIDDKGSAGVNFGVVKALKGLSR